MAFAFCGKGKGSEKKVTSYLETLDYLLSAKLYEMGTWGEEMKIKLGRADFFP